MPDLKSCSDSELFKWGSETGLHNGCVTGSAWAGVNALGQMRPSTHTQKPQHYTVSEGATSLSKFSRPPTTPLILHGFPALQKPAEHEVRCYRRRFGEDRDWMSKCSINPPPSETSLLLKPTDNTSWLLFLFSKALFVQVKNKLVWQRSRQSETSPQTYSWTSS